MLLFRRILGFKEETIQQRENRRAQRYAVSPSFPLKVVLNTLGRDEDAQLNKTKDGRGRNWGAQAVNLSSTGASILVSPSLLVHRGDTCTLTLTIENFVIVQRGLVAHYRGQRDYATIGIAFEAPEPGMQRAYLQLLEPLAIGESLKPVPAKQVRQDTPGQHKEQYCGEGDAQLTVWRATPESAPHAFEFRMHQCYARGSSHSSELAVYTLEDSPPSVHGYDAPALKRSPGHTREIQTLFRWTVPHLASAVPADVREFLAQFAQ